MVPVILRKLLRELRQVPHVFETYIQAAGKDVEDEYHVYWKDQILYEIRVRFNTGLMECWAYTPKEEKYKYDNSWIFNLPEDPGSPLEEIKVYHRYETNPFDDDYEEKQKYFIIQYQEYRKSFAAQRIMVHSLIARLVEEGWLHIEYPRDVLIDDFLKMKSEDLSKYILHGNTYKIPRPVRAIPGIRILEHFVPWGGYGDEQSIVNAWKRPFNLFRAIHTVINTKQDITRESITRALNHTIYGCGVQMFAPNLYRRIFKEFEIENMIMADPNPGIGYKALAAALTGCEYYYGDGPFAGGADKVGEFIDRTFKPLSSRDSYDVAILDSNWKTDEEKLIADIEEWSGRADMVLAYVPHGLRDRIVEEYCPMKQSKIIVNTLQFRDTIDYLMLI